MARLAIEVARHLPFLRRYARAVLGSREEGDADVRACLEGLLRRGSAWPDDGNVKLELYRLLHRVWRRGGAAPAETDPQRALVANQGIVALRVGQLDSTKRQILLLTVLEGLALPEAAAVLGLSLPAAASLLGQAKEEVRWQRASRVLILEDEPVIALDMAGTVEDSGHTVVGIAATHREAVQLARCHRPELILADIQLADASSGLDAVSEILTTGGELPVVFITAFPERLLTGLRPEPAFLITKPFDAEILRVSISQALARERAAAPAPPAYAH